MESGITIQACSRHLCLEKQKQTHWTPFEAVKPLFYLKKYVLLNHLLAKIVIRLATMFKAWRFVIGELVMFRFIDGTDMVTAVTCTDASIWAQRGRLLKLWIVLLVFGLP